MSRRAAVLGHPVRHSLSPTLHAAAYRALGLDWTYTAHEVDEAALPAFLDGLGPEWAGLSLTMPLKRTALDLCEEVSPMAEAVRAVNTVTFDGHDCGERRRVGDNTDVPGMVAALAEAGVARVRNAAVLGGGATAGSALAAIAPLCVDPVTAYVRTQRRAGELGELAARLGAGLRIRPWSRAADALGAELIVSTTPVGAADHLAACVPPRPATLFDVVYDPWPTPLARAWSACGGRVISGLDLLVHQAVLQVACMTGRSVDSRDLVPVMRAAGEAAVGG